MKPGPGKPGRVRGGWVLALAAACGACSEVPPPASWGGRLDVSDMPDDHAVVVGAALAAWRAADPRVTAALGTGGTPVVLGGVGEGHGGLYTGDALHVLPCDTTTGAGYDACYQVAAHEIGHWLGAEHVADASAIMYKDCTGATVLTTADHAALAAVVGE